MCAASWRESRCTGVSATEGAHPIGGTRRARPSPCRPDSRREVLPCAATHLKGVRRLPDHTSHSGRAHARAPRTCRAHTARTKHAPRIWIRTRTTDADADAPCMR
eukprot:1931447-Prymnesium_polylepis.2